ncbi:MAG: AMP-binding protein [Deltaproteobacteria bacterium]|nr:AMP-binding protein [Deltaproteobacteria bacterium]MBI3387107.1 AMP-binding protein [Deltaproteobacteria bacterium]
MSLQPTHRPPADAPDYRPFWGELPLHQHVDRTVAAHANDVAVIDGTRQLTFLELDRLSQRAARGLRQLGLGAGDVIAYQLPNWWEAVVMFLAATRLGATVNPLLPIFGARELEFSLRQSGARAAIIPGTYRGVDYPALWTALRSNLPQLEFLFVARDAAAPDLRSLSEFLDTPWERALRPEMPPPGATDPGAILMLMYTSGTTAEPKGVLHTHQSLIAEVRSLERVHQLTPADRTLMPSPLTHISGVIHAILTPALLGTSAVLMDRWEPTRAIELIARERVTYMVGAPTFLQDLLAHADSAPQHDLSSLRLFSCGGAGVSPELMRRARERLPHCVTKRVYGSTEFPTLTTTGADDALARGIDSEGRAIWPAEIRIADESGASVAAGSEGEVQGRGPECFAGYLDTALNTESFTSDGWFRTGDLGVLDAAGYLRITGRLKDIIIRKGEKISVKEVEDLIAEHPAVAEVALIPRPDAATGERACAVVRLRPGATIDLPSLTAFLTTKGLAKQKWPEQLDVVADFPRTGSGKILRAKL